MIERHHLNSDWLENAVYTIKLPGPICRPEWRWHCESTVKSPTQERWGYRQQ